jgi:hypothetical protein
VYRKHAIVVILIAGRRHHPPDIGPNHRDHSRCD